MSSILAARGPATPQETAGGGVKQVKNL